VISRQAVSSTPRTVCWLLSASTACSTGSVTG
jgi:hypothetical protein